MINRAVLIRASGKLLTKAVHLNDESSQRGREEQTVRGQVIKRIYDTFFFILRFKKSLLENHAQKKA